MSYARIVASWNMLYPDNPILVPKGYEEVPDPQSSVTYPQRELPDDDPAWGLILPEDEEG
jgi:hypothetical protein